MRKIFNLVAIIIMIISFCGLEYLIDVHNNAINIIMPTREDTVKTIKILSNIQYGAHKKQSLDIYLPPAGISHKVMFFVHGGAWSSGDKDMYGSIGYFYAKNGFITVLIDHRLSPEVSHPSHIEDVALAFSWTKKNIANYGGNPNNIYICGHSSGAHLVSLLATNKKYLAKEGLSRSDISGVIAISGIYKIGLNLNIAGYGYVFPTKTDKYDASPINFIEEGIPPFLIMYAEKDITTLGRQAINFHKAIKNKGVVHPLYCAKGENHSTILLDCATFDKSSKIIIDFMK
jgi:acetyl esterase/lipase